MSKHSLSNGVTLKVETRSGFDKGFFNALTTGVGTLTPLVKQLLIPSAGRMSLKISAQLPPLASDAFLRTHLKVEAFAVPMRICYGGFESWLCGREIWDSDAQAFTRAKLPYAFLSGPGDQTDLWHGAVYTDDDQGVFSSRIQDGPGSLHDYLGVHFHSGDPQGKFGMYSPAPQSGSKKSIDIGNDIDIFGCRANIFPYVCYGLIYDEWYRNKLVQKPLFGPPSARPNQTGSIDSLHMQAGNLPFMSVSTLFGVINDTNRHFTGSINGDVISGDLFNGNLFQLRQRNYGDDYFTAATPSAQEGDPAFIDTSSGGFTIGALRLQNSMQEFKERNEYASPDYLQTLVVRWGVAPSASIAQKPILVGSADFPMYTSGVEQTAQGTGQSTSNPFASVGARYGRGHAEGTDFVCDFDVKEPSYLMVLVSLVPEATYLQGFDHDMQILTEEGSIVDLPSAQFENVGNEPIFKNEIVSGGDGVFGYVQRYLWHKLGNRNQAHGLFKTDLRSFIVQRRFIYAPQLGSDFLQVATSDLDNVAAVAGDVSKYGVMIDARIDLSVSEPLSESSIPSLSDPAQEHGYNVYVKTGGSKLA